MLGQFESVTAFCGFCRSIWVSRRLEIVEGEIVVKKLQQIAAVLVVSGGVAAFGGCVSAPPSTPLYASAYQSPNALECRRTVKTGTRIANRECRRRSEWAAEAARGRAVTQKVQLQQRSMLQQ